MIKYLRLLFAAILFLAFSKASAQNVYQPYSYQFYQKLNSAVYGKESRFHSSLKPFRVDDSTIVARYYELINLGVDTGASTWLKRKLTNEHLVDVRKQGYTFYADVLGDVQLGKDFGTSEKTIWTNTRGYQVGGTIGKDFSYYTSGLENQARFPTYVDDYINRTNTVPGQFYDRSFGKQTKDWSYVTALISYTPAKFINVALGYDKNFIGDGYRSMLLSDYASPYTFLKVTAELGSVQYTAIWAAMQDPSAPKFSYEAGNRKKGAVFHYLDWNITNRLSLGFFDSIIWGNEDDAGNTRGFDWGYANPLIFLRPVEASSGSPDNAMMGFNGKYKFSNNVIAYGQFALDEFESKNFFSSSGSSRNKYAWQIGFKGFDVFQIKNLNYLIEYNTAKPYTYTSRKPIINYAHYNESLAHPLGANFREVVGIANYSYKRFDFFAQAMFAKYGLDGANQNFGKNIFVPYIEAQKLDGNYTTQGIRTDLYYFDGRVSYLVNPKYNVRFEVGGVFRNEINSLGNNKNMILTLGLRSSFRNIYHDF